MYWHRLTGSVEDVSNTGTTPDSDTGVDSSSEVEASISGYDDGIDPESESDNESHVRVSSEALRLHPVNPEIDVDNSDSDKQIGPHCDHQVNDDPDAVTSNTPRQTRVSSACNFDVKYPIKGFPLSSDGGIISLAKRYMSLRNMISGPLSVQNFVGSPQAQKYKEVQLEQVVEFFEVVGENAQNWTIHASHATNLASANQNIANASMDSVAIEMRNCNSLGISTLCVHLGEAQESNLQENITRIVKRLESLLDRVPKVDIALENMTRRSSSCGDTWSLQSIAAIISSVGSPRIKACVDICHAYITGYDFYSPTAVDAFVADLKVIGPERVAGFHVSDSSTIHGRRCDGHANIGCGLIPMNVFRTILRDPAYLGRVPYYLETPNHTSIRPKFSPGIDQQELKRRILEWEFLERVICMPDEEWTQKRSDHELKRYLSLRKVPQDSIKNLAKKTNSLRSTYDKDMKRNAQNRGKVNDGKKTREGSKPSKPKDPRKNVESFALEESVELGMSEASEGTIEGPYLLRKKRARTNVPVPDKYRWISNAANEYCSVVVGIRSSTRGMIAAASPGTPNFGGGGGGGLSRTRSGRVR